MKHLLWVITLGLLLASCGEDKNTAVNEHRYTNDLVHETSPYLLQHAHNPINWQGWNPETLSYASETNQLMIVSIGYAACHWCHVMEKESFEDTTVAAVMNDRFVSVKVDREERPDVDQVYINAVQLMTGNAGWPLNVITLPDGRPVWGGTYFKKEQWLQAIEQVADLYDEDPSKLVAYADRLEEGIKSMDLIELNTDEVDYSKFDNGPLTAFWKQRFDTINGGTKGAPKFMMPSDWSLLLREGVEQQDQELLDQVKLTLDKMAYGGLYDHIGGGFARYSVDPYWHVPHFEKMLYDNAQLVSLYSQAYQVFHDPHYQEIVEGILTFVQREMTHPEGMFYSSLDADSEEEDGSLVEGAFYSFSMEELQNLLGEAFEDFATYYNVNEKGLWEEEGVYVLFRDQDDISFAAARGWSLQELQINKAAWNEKVFLYRSNRISPRLDNKSLTSWNAWMIKGYLDAYRAFGNNDYLEAALKNAHFVKDQQNYDGDRLWHSYKEGNSTIPGYLEDYAAVIMAFIELYEVTLDFNWLQSAYALANTCFDRYFDPESGMFYFTASDADPLLTRSIEYRDNVIPASNSVLAKGLFLLAHHFDDKRMATTARQMLQNVQKELEQYPSGFSNWQDLLKNYQNKFYEIVVVGPEAISVANEFNLRYMPNSMIAGSTTPGEAPLLKGRYAEGRTMIYVCVNNTCKLPVDNVDAAVQLLD